MTPDETRVTPWIKFGHHGFTHVRIWMRKAHGQMFQLHQWKRADGSLVNEEWIISTPSWTTGAIPTKLEP